MTAKESATAMIQKMPDDCTWENILYRIHLSAKIDRSMAEIEAGEGIPHEQVMQEIEEWLESSGARQPVSSTSAS